MLARMGVGATVSVMESDECPQFIIRTREGGLLIGEGGRRLIALSHLVKKMAEAELCRAGLEKIQFMLDVNDYQTKKIENLRNMAKMGAQRARYFGKPVTLEPMSSYDRRIIHATLAEYPDIETESVGEDPRRKVVIKLI